MLSRDPYSSYRLNFGCVLWELRATCRNTIRTSIHVIHYYYFVIYFKKIRRLSKRLFIIIIISAMNSSTWVIFLRGLDDTLGGLLQFILWWFLEAIVWCLVQPHPSPPGNFNCTGFYILQLTSWRIIVELYQSTTGVPRKKLAN